MSWALYPPPMTHHRLMILWASSYHPGLLTDDERTAWLAEISKLQRTDGGWNTASLGDWRREDGSPQDTVTSDGYATGLAVYVLRRSGIPASDQRVTAGIAWLKPCPER